MTLMAALLVGLLGSVHCIGMCGGIVGLFGAGLESSGRGNFLSRLPFWIAYNAGRIASYTAAGALAGWLGGRDRRGRAPARAHDIGLMFAGGFMIALGLYLSGWWQGLQWLERGGAVVWKRLEPLGRRVLRSSSPLRALGLGAVWGWLPCGLVYSVLAWALTVGSPAGGALLMLAFGLGTLPMLLTLGAAADRLLRWRRSPLVRQVAGVVVILFGVLTFLGIVHPLQIDTGIDQTWCAPPS